MDSGDGKTERLLAVTCAALRLCYSLDPMIDEQRLAIFNCISKYLFDREELKGAALDLRPYVEPVIDSMLDEARKEAVKEYIDSLQK